MGLAGSTLACGDDSPAAPTDTVATSLPSVAAWCVTFAEDLPAAASPNPDGRELEVLDLHIANARALEAGAPGVTEEAKMAARKTADIYVAIRQRVADGEELPDVLAELFEDPDNELVEAGRIVDAEADALC